MLSCNLAPIRRPLVAFVVLAIVGWIPLFAASTSAQVATKSPAALSAIRHPARTGRLDRQTPSHHTPHRSASVAVEHHLELSAQSVQPGDLVTATYHLNLAEPAGRLELMIPLPDELSFVRSTSGPAPTSVDPSSAYWKIEPAPAGELNLIMLFVAQEPGQVLLAMTAILDGTDTGSGESSTTVAPTLLVGGELPCACAVGDQPFVQRRLTNRAARPPLPFGPGEMCHFPESQNASEGALLYDWHAYQICGTAPQAAVITLSGEGQVAIYQSMLDQPTCFGALAAGAAGTPIPVTLQPGPFAVAVFDNSVESAEGSLERRIRIELPCNAGSPPNPGPPGTPSGAPMRLAIPVHDAFLQAKVGPNQWNEVITSTVTTPDGAAKAGGSAHAPFGGRTSIELRTPSGPGDVVPLRPGDVVTLESANGDPVRVTLPGITTRTNVRTGVIAGDAPPGAKLQVRAGEALQTVTADAAGHYEAHFDAAVDFVQINHGTVNLTNAGGHRFYAEWVNPQVTLVQDFAGFSGDGPSGREVEASLLGPDGTTVADARTMAETSGRRGWAFKFKDASGALVWPQPGDTVKVQVADDSVSLPVPRVTAQFDLIADRLLGQAPPGAKVYVDVGRQRLPYQPITSTQVVAGADGRFVLDLAAEADLRHDSVAELDFAGDDYVVIRYVHAAQLQLDVDDASVRGLSDEQPPVSVELRGAGGVRATARVEAGPLVEDETYPFWVSLQQYNFTAAFRDPAGLPVRPQPGDEVVVYLPATSPEREVHMRVPDLSLTLNRATGTASGRAPAGGWLDVSYYGIYDFPLDLTSLDGEKLDRKPDGQFVATFRPLESGDQLVPQPGNVVQADYEDEEGFFTRRRVAVPIVSIPFEGAKVCGLATPGSAVAARLKDANGRVVAQGRSVAAQNSVFRLDLRDAAGRAVSPSVGQTVDSDVSGETVGLKVPKLELPDIWSESVGFGQYLPNSVLSVVYPSSDCISGDGLSPDVIDYKSSSYSDDTGELIMDSGAHASPGAGLLFEFSLPGGHVFHYQAIRTRAELHANPARVTGQATAFSPVTATLLSAAGAQRAEATGVADVDGHIDLLFKAGDGSPMAMKPGDTVNLDTPGQHSEVVYEDMDFDFSAADGVLGHAPPGRPLKIELTLAPRPGRPVDPIVFTRTADAGGRFTFGPAQVPPRAGWTLSDVVRVRAILGTSSGHEVVAEVRIGNASRLRLFMPWIGRGAIRQ